MVEMNRRGEAEKNEAELYGDLCRCAGGVAVRRGVLSRLPGEAAVPEGLRVAARRTEEAVALT